MKKPATDVIIMYSKGFTIQAFVTILYPLYRVYKNKTYHFSSSAFLFHTFPRRFFPQIPFGSDQKKFSSGHMFAEFRHPDLFNVFESGQIVDGEA